MARTRAAQAHAQMGEIVSMYVSPIARARAIVSGLENNVSDKEREVAARMVRLPVMVIIDLERAEAPKFVFRWVAWGANHTTQRQRTDLVLYLRRSIARRLNGWFEERHLSAALAVLEAARDEARRRGGIMPHVDQIPVEVYRAAVEGRQKQKRARALEPELEEAIEIENDEATTLEGENEVERENEADDAGDVEDEDEGEGDDEAPISERVLVGRQHVLRHLSDAVREALAVEDIEAADAINDTIARLCGGRGAG